MKRFTVIAISGICVFFILSFSAMAEELHFDVWSNTTAYNSQHAEATIELDPGTVVISGSMDITAFNGDTMYLRVLDFFLGEDPYRDGGPLGCYYWAPGQLSGSGVLAPNSSDSWQYDLADTMVADIGAPGGYRMVDFIDLINSLLGVDSHIPMEAWVTTTAANSWVTMSMDLVVEGADDDTVDDDVVDDDVVDDDIVDDDVVDDDVVDDDVVDDDVVDDDVADDDVVDDDIADDDTGDDDFVDDDVVDDDLIDDDMGNDDVDDDIDDLCQQFCDKIEECLETPSQILGDAECLDYCMSELPYADLECAQLSDCEHFVNCLGYEVDGGTTTSTDEESCGGCGV